MPHSDAARDTKGPVSPPLEPHELLTVQDVATLLRVSRSWVYEHSRSRPRGGARAGSDTLPHIKIGKYLRFDAQAVRDFLARRSRAA